MIDHAEALVRALTEVMRVHAPGWTDPNDSDPGVTILEMFAYLADDLRFRGAPSAERAAAAARAIAALQNLTNTGLPSGGTASGIEVWSGITRPNYFAGRLLTVDALREEQQFHIDTHRRHLRLMHGWGVVTGLTVAVESDHTTIHVEAGVAVDPLGNELALVGPHGIAASNAPASSLSVVLEYAERALDAVPAPDGEPQPSRIEEGCRLVTAPLSGASGVVIARLLRTAEGWRLDPTFRPKRL